MKKIFWTVLVCLLLSSCAAVDLDKRTRRLELGMSRKEAVRVLTKNYTIEAKTLSPEGDVETLHFYATVGSDYLLRFLNGGLVEFHRYTAPPGQREPVIRIETVNK